MEVGLRGPAQHLDASGELIDVHLAVLVLVEGVVDGAQLPDVIRLLAPSERIQTVESRGGENRRL